MLVIFVGVLFFYSSCDDKETLGKTSQAIIKGKCTFYNVFEGAMQTNDSIEIYIESLSANTALSSGMPQIIMGSKFQFGPLDLGDYLLKGEFEDVENDIVYVVNDTVHIALKSDLIIKDLLLTPSFSTQFIWGRIRFKDIFTNDIAGVASLDISEIKAIDSFVNLPNDGASILSAPEYMFGPLVPGNYLLTFRYTDSYGLLHELSDTVSLGESVKSGERDYVLDLSNEKRFVKGHIQYMDILTGQLCDAFNLKTSKIRTFNSYSQLPNNGESTLPAPNYMFGPLGNQNYIQSFSFEDDYGLLHSVIDTLYMDNFDVLNEKNYTLTIDPNTVLIAQVVDSLENGIENVKVYLYNNYDYLEKYRANETAAIDFGITNKDGKVIFTDLNAARYYLYGEKIIMQDTLETYNSEFDPSIQGPVIRNEINVQQIIIR